MWLQNIFQLRSRLITHGSKFLSGSTNFIGLWLLCHFETDSWTMLESQLIQIGGFKKIHSMFERKTFACTCKISKLFDSPILYKILESLKMLVYTIKMQQLGSVHESNSDKHEEKATAVLRVLSWRIWKTISVLHPCGHGTSWPTANHSSRGVLQIKQCIEIWNQVKSSASRTLTINVQLAQHREHLWYFDFEMPHLPEERSYRIYILRDSQSALAFKGLRNMRRPSKISPFKPENICCGSNTWEKQWNRLVLENTTLNYIFKSMKTPSKIHCGFSVILTTKRFTCNPSIFLLSLEKRNLF